MTKAHSNIVFLWIASVIACALPSSVTAQLTWGTAPEIYDVEDVDQIWPELPDPTDVKLSELKDAKRYEYGKYHLEFSMPFCGKHIKSQNTESFELLPGKEKGLQRALSAIGERIAQDCLELETISFLAKWKGPKGVVEKDIFIKRNDYWLIGDGIRHKWWGVYYAHHLTPNFEEKWIKDRDEMLAKAKTGDNPLKDRGFDASKLHHVGDRFKVYTGLQTFRSGQLGSIVIVHNGGDDKSSFMDTEVKTLKAIAGLVNKRVTENSWVFPTEVALADLQSAIDKLNLPINRRGTRVVSTDFVNILHYVDGYHHPETNRYDFTQVEQVEPPLFNQTLKLALRDRPVIVPNEKIKIRQADTKIDANYRGPFLSVAEIKQRYTPPKPQVAARASEITSPSPKFISRKEEERQRAIEANYIFKNEIFWSMYYGSVVRDIFDGNNPALLTRRSPMVSLVLTQYLWRLSDTEVCRQTIRDPVEAVIKTIETGPNGTTRLPDEKLVIPRRFSNVMEEYINDSSPLTGYILRSSIQDRLNSGANNRFDFRQQAALLDNMLNAQHDVKVLFETQSCGNAFHRQFEENLYRMTHDAWHWYRSAKRFRHSRRV